MADGLQLPVEECVANEQTCMPPKESSVLCKVYPTFVQYMNPYPVLDVMTEEDVLHPVILRDMKESGTTSDTNRKLLQCIRSRNSHVFNKFKECLQKTGQELLLALLETAEKGEDTTEIRRMIKQQSHHNKDFQRNKSISQKLDYLIACENARQSNRIEKSKDYTSDSMIHRLSKQQVKTEWYGEKSLNFPVRMLTDRECSQLSRAIGYVWKTLALDLGLSNVQLQHIDMDNPRTMDKVYEMLLAWKDRAGDTATFDVLVKELCRLPKDSVDWDIVHTLKDGFC